MVIPTDTPEQPFQPTGAPLPTDELMQRSTITLADVQNAVKQAAGKIRPFLKAKVSDGRG